MSDNATPRVVVQRESILHGAAASLQMYGLSLPSHYDYTHEGTTTSETAPALEHYSYSLDVIAGDGAGGYCARGSF